MFCSAHADRFAQEQLPPREQWPELVFDRPELRYPPRLNCVAELLDRWVASGYGDRPALADPSGVVSYAQLLATVNRIAAVLVEDLGMVSGNRVLLRGGNTVMMAACWLAVVKAGGIAVATMPLLRAREITAIAVKARTRFALCDRALDAELDAALPHCPELLRLLHFHDENGLEAHMRSKSGRFATTDTAADDICLIAFTSGSGGIPKATLHFHRDVMAICDCFPRSILGLAQSDLICGTPPLAFTYGLGGLLLFPLRVGACTLLLDNPRPETLLASIQDRRATTLFATPTFYRLMAPLAGSFDLAGLRHCVSAGEALPVATRELWRSASGKALIDGLGTTEMLHIFISASGEDIRPGAIGRVLPGYQARVVDASGQALAHGKVGRLAIKGPTGCRYLADDRQRTFVQDGWNLTGDACRMDADGYFFYQGRSDDMIVSSGYNIAGPEVENVLLAHPRVAECAVVGVADPLRGQIVKAYVVLHSGVDAQDALIEELKEWVRNRLAPYKYPRAMEFVPHLPRSEAGKLQRFRLRTQTSAKP